jgi:hypothetical protein
LEAACCVTQFEEDLRRDGTITIKTPDVWGDRNLMPWIQEFDEQLQSRVGSFTETIQSVSASLDGSKFEISTLTGSALADKDKEVSSLKSMLPLASTEAKPFELLSALKSAGTTEGKLQLEQTEKLRQEATYVYVNQALRRKNVGGDNTRQAGYGLYLFRMPISVLPGSETTSGYAAVAHLRARMVVTPADVKYTLPRMAVADLVDQASDYVTKNWGNVPDQTAANLAELRKWFEECRNEIAAYQNYHQAPDSLVIDYSNLSNLLEDFHSKDRYSDSKAFDARVIALNNAARALKLSLPSRVVNDGQTDCVTNPPNLLQSWQRGAETSGDMAAMREPIIPTFPIPNSAQHSVEASGTGVPQIARSQIAQGNLDAILFYLKRNYGNVLGNKPSLHEVRNTLFSALVQVISHLEVAQALTGHVYRYPVCQGQTLPAIELAALRIEQGCPDTDLQQAWEDGYRISHCNGYAVGDDAYVTTAWLVARQCGLVDLNIKRLLKELALSNKADPCDVELANSINFFSERDLQIAVAMWQKIVDTKFPVQVFTLEPVVDEQNVVEAVSRLRDMQFALAYSVAQGGFGTAQRVAAARRLARDTSALGLNRTVVGFSHGDDTFGWYFYPRVQPPAIDSSNLKAWSSTLTGRGASVSDELKSRRIEPGIRECEVLIAMPNFISEIEFDTTTNWESLACPGKPKQSYQEMLDRGARFEKLQQNVKQVQCGGNYRPGDIERLQSRVQQMENMLNMQTHLVSVPYSYKQSAVDLFGQGDETLVPEIQGYYGLQFVGVNPPTTQPNQAVVAEFFITGKNFHPTQTHVIVGGHATQNVKETGQSAPVSRIDVLSRNLIKVSTVLKEGRFSGNEFEVRVGTPNGLSNPLNISDFVDRTSGGQKSDIDWKGTPRYSGSIAKRVVPLPKTSELEFKFDTAVKLELVANGDIGFKVEELDASDFKIKYSCVIKFADGTERKLDSSVAIISKYDKLGLDFSESIKKRIEENWYRTDNPPATVTITTYVKLDTWPIVKCDSPIVIDIKPEMAKAH